MLSTNIQFNNNSNGGTQWLWLFKMGYDQDESPFMPIPILNLNVSLLPPMDIAMTPHIKIEVKYDFMAEVPLLTPNNDGNDKFSLLKV